MIDRLFEIIMHTDDALLALVAENVNKAYLFLFLLILLETGLIFFPFLPGDGLLFSAGVVAASTNMDIWLLVILLIIAAILGNFTNFYVGKFLGYELRKSNNYYIKNHLMKYMSQAEGFYKKHGGGAIIIGRFFPIIRTYIPFLAGVVKMQPKVFIKNTVIGAVLWVTLFSLTGYFVGEIEWVKNNYGLIFLGLIVITILPFFFTLVKRIVKIR